MSGTTERTSPAFIGAAGFATTTIAPHAAHMAAIAGVLRAAGIAAPGRIELTQSRLGIDRSGSTHALEDQRLGGIDMRQHRVAAVAQAREDPGSYRTVLLAAQHEGDR